MLERHWKYYPALKLAISFAAGIVAAKILSPSLEPILIGLYGSLGWLILAMIRDRMGIALPMLASVALCGALLFLFHDRSSPAGLDGTSVRDVELIGRVMGDPVARRNRFEIVIECDSMLYRNSVAHLAARGLVRLYDASPFDPMLLPRYGERISVTGVLKVPGRVSTPGGFDYAAYLDRHGIDFTLNTNRARSIHIYQRDELAPIEHCVLAVRRQVRAFADRYVGGEEGDIMRALLLGERDYIDPEIREAFMRTGTVHVLSVSGLHVGVIAMALFVIVSWIRNRFVQTSLFLLMLFFYTIIAGGEASIVRASVMAATFMIARAAYRISRPLNTLGVAALVILVIEPAQLFDLGFQLSFASMAGILLLYGRGERLLLDRLPSVRRIVPLRHLLQMFLLTMSAQLFTLPFVLYHFGYISLIALVINIPVIPLFSIALGAGGVGAMIASLIPSAGAAFGASSYLAVRCAGMIVESGAGLSVAGLETGMIGSVGAIVIGAGAIYLAMSSGAAQGIIRGAWLVLLVLCVLMIDRMLDPLVAGSEGSLILIPRNGGVMAATALDDTLTMYVNGRFDSVAIDYVGESLRRRFGAEHLHVDHIDSIQIERARDEMIVNDYPREIALRRLPVILSSTGHRPLGLVRAGGETLLQVPLEAELDDAIVLRYEEQWRRVDWR